MSLPKLRIYSYVLLGTLGCLMSPLNVVKYYVIKKKAKVDTVFLRRLILQKIGLINWNGMGVTSSTLLAHLKIEKVSGIA